MTNRNLFKSSIFLADDDPDDLELLLRAFHEITNEHEFTTVNSGKALVELLSNTSDSQLPGLIVLDYNMPEMDGKRTLRLLQNTDRYKTIPKIIFTTSGLLIEREEFLKIGACEYLRKPSSMNEIIHSAEIMLSRCNDYVLHTG
jgi:CheY-like chemotaxis protein